MAPKKAKRMLDVVEALERLPPITDDGLTRRVIEMRKRSRKDKLRIPKF